jgi:hypothetical protein
MPTSTETEDLEAALGLEKTGLDRHQAVRPRDLRAHSDFLDKPAEKPVEVPPQPTPPQPEPEPEPAGS